MRLDIEGVDGDTDRVWEVLYEALEQAWVRIEASIMKDLVRSMERRVKAVIAADGWYMNHQVRIRARNLMYIHMVIVA